MHKRFHVIIVREDGKQYHNRVLEWFQVRKHLMTAGAVLGSLVLGTVAFLCLALVQGNLVRKNVLLAHREKRLEQALRDLGKNLDDANVRLGQSQSRLSGIEELARKQHLKITPTAGVGGAHTGAESGDIRVCTPDGSARSLSEGVLSLREQVDYIFKETKAVSRALRPRLDQMAHTPSTWPVPGFISSGFGYRHDPMNGSREFHEGIDIATRYGTPIKAPAEGLVVFTGWRSGYGKCIEISHGMGLSTRYAHLSKILIKNGDHVRRYQVIGRTGSTGRSTGPHLHYEVRRKGVPINPKRFLLY